MRPERKFLLLLDIFLPLLYDEDCMKLPVFPPGKKRRDVEFSLAAPPPASSNLCQRRSPQCYPLYTPWVTTYSPPESS